MINIFEVFLPQLLRYPNPNDPLNGEAAALLMRHPKEYEAKVKGALRCVTCLVVLVLMDSQSMYNGSRLRKLRMQQQTAKKRNRTRR